MNWNRATLKEESSVITKGTTPTTLGHAFTDEGIPFLRAQNLLDGTISVDADPLFISRDTHSALKRSVIKGNDILISIAGTIGRASIVPKEAPEMNCNQAVAIVRPSERIDRRFMLHWLSSQDAISQMARGKVTGVISNLSLGQIGNLQIPLPPLDEQKRIAAILDQADELRRKRQRAIDRLNQLGQAIFHDMFGEKILLGENRKTIDQVSQRVTKGESPKWQGHSYVDSGALFVTSENVGWGKMINKTPKFVPLDFHEGKLLRSQLRQGDMLINLVGASIGRACLFHSEFEEANINQAVAVVSLEHEHPIADYLLAYFLSPVGQAQILGNRVEGARANISLKNVRDFSFYMPTKDELLQFNQAQTKLAEMRDAAQSLLEQTSSLFVSIQHTAFKGEL